MKRVVTLMILAAAGCHSAVSPQSVRDQRQAKLDQIADKCGLARSTFKLVGDDELHVMPSPDAKYESVDCALTELRDAKLPVKMGFVGNEYYARNEQ